MKKIFVYGSLKRKEYNYKRFLDDPKTKFLHIGVLRDYTLYTLGAYPCAVKEPKSYVQGEIFSVSNRIFNIISEMETHAMFLRGCIKGTYFFYMEEDLAKKYGVRIGSIWSYKLHG